MRKIRRYLRWYDKTNEFAVSDEDLKDIGLGELRNIFGVPKTDPMYDCWEVKQEHLASLQKHVDHEIDLCKYDYFVEASESIE